MALSIVLQEAFAQRGIQACDDLLKMAARKVSQGFGIIGAVELAMQEWDEMWEAAANQWEQEQAHYAQFDF